METDGNRDTTESTEVFVVVGVAHRVGSLSKENKMPTKSEFQERRKRPERGFWNDPKWIRLFLLAALVAIVVEMVLKRKEATRLRKDPKGKGCSLLVAPVEERRRRTYTSETQEEKRFRTEATKTSDVVCIHVFTYIKLNSSSFFKLSQILLKYCQILKLSSKIMFCSRWLQ